MKINAQKMLELEPLSSAPTSPVEGQLYYNSTDKKMKLYDGSSWADAGSAPDASRVKLDGNGYPTYTEFGSSNANWGDWYVELGVSASKKYYLLHTSYPIFSGGGSSNAPNFPNVQTYGSTGSPTDGYYSYWTTPIAKETIHTITQCKMSDLVGVNYDQSAMGGTMETRESAIDLTTDPTTDFATWGSSYGTSPEGSHTANNPNYVVTKFDGWTGKDLIMMFSTASVSTIAYPSGWQRLLFHWWNGTSWEQLKDTGLQYFGGYTMYGFLWKLKSTAPVYVKWTLSNQKGFSSATISNVNSYKFVAYREPVD